MFILLLRFDWRDVARRFKQAFPVEPIDPLKSFPFDLIFGFPRSEVVDDLGFEQTDDRLGQRVIIAVTRTADGRLQPGVSEAFGVFDRHILAAAIRMVDELSNEPARMDHLFERIQNKLCVLRCRCLPADDAVREGVDDKDNINEPTPGRHKREVGHPQLV